MATASSFKIDTDIPAPAAHHSIRYPFRDMAVGDSFGYAADLHTKVYPAASCFGKRNDMRFSIRKQADGSYRCWRLA